MQNGARQESQIILFDQGLQRPGSVKNHKGAGAARSKLDAWLRLGASRASAIASAAS